jgi:hypothetical protein
MLQDIKKSRFLAAYFLLPPPWQLWPLDAVDIDTASTSRPPPMQ